MNATSFRTLALPVSLVLSVIQFGCGEARPTKVLHLQVTSTGQYLLEGTEYTEVQYIEALATAKRGGIPLELEINAAPDANFQQVGKAVSLAQSQQIALIRFTNTGATAASAVSGSK